MRKYSFAIIFTLFASVSAGAWQTPVPVSGATPVPEVPLCRAAVEGQLSCQANRVCECQFETAIPARRLPDRWRWDCSILRGFCQVTAPDSGTTTQIDPSNFLLFDQAGAQRDVVVSGRIQKHRTNSTQRP